MNDTKNLLLAWVSSVSSVFAAIEYRGLLTLITAIVLPIVFFTFGKAVDVLVQIYLHGRKPDVGRQRK